MAKKTKSKPKQSKAEWSSEDEISLLAWLDHTLKNDEIDFQKTAVEHLNNAFTWKKIDGKLWRLWHTYGPSVPADMTQRQWKTEKSIYDHGSGCLVGLSENDKREIASTTQLLEDEFIASQIAASSQRQLRSASKFDRSSSIRDSGSWPRSTSREEPRINASELTTPSSSPLHVKSDVKNIKTLSSEPIPPPKRQKILPKKIVGIQPSTRFASRS